MKFLSNILIKVLSLPVIKPASCFPTDIKTYPCRPYLPIRIFYPKTYKTGDLLPLYMDIHGGGFAVMSPVIDDKFCSFFAKRNSVLVVSLDYPKAPRYKFPEPTAQLIDVINAILEDESLPFDREKIAIGGFSAGGNLSLSVAQHPSLQGKIKGVVAYYPVTDFSVPIQESLDTRPAHADKDLLANDAAMFNFGYIKEGQDLRDPLLSVVFAEKEKLPKKICIVGCEFDLLCKRAEDMAEIVAGGKEGNKEVVWEKNGIRWEKILGEVHGKFPLSYARVQVLSREKKVIQKFQGFDIVLSRGAVKGRRSQRALKMHEGVSDWLSREVYSATN